MEVTPFPPTRKTDRKNETQKNMRKNRKLQKWHVRKNRTQKHAQNNTQKNGARKNDMHYAKHAYVKTPTKHSEPTLKHHWSVFRVCRVYVFQSHTDIHLLFADDCF